MKIDIKTCGFELDRELNHFAMCCAAFELGIHKGRIDSVQIHLARAPESRDSKDRHCLVDIDLSDGDRISARVTDIDLHMAIYRALERAGSISTQRLSSEHLDAGTLPVPQQQPTKPGKPNWAA